MKRTRKAATRKSDEALEIDTAFQPGSPTRVLGASEWKAVVDAFAKDRQVTCGKMMSAVGLKVKGKIFAMMWRGKLVVKIRKPRVDTLVSAGKGENFDPGHGRLMKEWIAVPPGNVPWIELAKEAYEFVKQGAR